ncbi:hypothetical protein NDU88_005184 [Pleurodeles waltl]|uniref:Uncharacterized protein n=1 Tax=Pleurodeles waltl TaxID=8319 RepID=A0AAV7TU27_PLEWA|nr:hypothetical protein NDU88_005184 [Pleurodeles waltl]
MSLQQRSPPYHLWGCLFRPGVVVLATAALCHMPQGCPALAALREGRLAGTHLPSAPQGRVRVRFQRVDAAGAILRPVRRFIEDLVSGTLTVLLPTIHCNNVPALQQGILSLGQEFAGLCAHSRQSCTTVRPFCHSSLAPHQKYFS